MDDLALQVGGVDDVEVDEAERADAGRGQIEAPAASPARRRRRTARCAAFSFCWPSMPTSGMIRWRE